MKENIGEEVETLFFAVITELQLNYNFHLISTDFQQSAAKWLYMSDADFITPIISIGGDVLENIADENEELLFVSTNAES